MFTRCIARRGLTLIEVVVVVALVGLTVLLLGPALTRTREAASSSACLANLRAIGTATQLYAAEDEDNLIVPIHRNMVRSASYWDWRTIQWFGWGGQNATAVLMTTPSGGYWLSDEPPPSGAGGWKPEYGASQRPLNSYVAPEALGIFHCPADVGYPYEPQYVNEVPPSSAGTPCWDMLGNSYRANLKMVLTTAPGGTTSTSMFSTGPWGHQLSTLTETSRLLLMAEAILGTQIRLYTDQVPPGPPPDSITLAWHGTWMTQNALFCDGSARPAMTAPRQPGGLLVEEAEDVEGAVEPPPDPYPCVYDELRFERPRFRMDCYPTPGAIIFGISGTGGSCWPYAGAQDNLGD